jgi:hypothetical protein
MMQKDEVRRIRWQAWVIRAAEHRTNLSKLPIAALFLQFLHLVLNNFLSEYGSSLAHNLGKHPRIPAAARSDIGNNRSFTQAKV